jgi:hypothetical protein
MFWHQVANQLLTLMTNILYNSILTDMETGYKVFKREVIEGLNIRSKRFNFEPEFTAKGDAASGDRRGERGELALEAAVIRGGQRLAVWIAQEDRTAIDGKERLKLVQRAFQHLLKGDAAAHDRADARQDVEFAAGPLSVPARAVATHELSCRFSPRGIVSERARESRHTQ